jgi:hypothetical protein
MQANTPRYGFFTAILLKEIELCVAATREIFANDEIKCARGFSHLNVTANDLPPRS